MLAVNDGDTKAALEVVNDRLLLVADNDAKRAKL